MADYSEATKVFLATPPSERKRIKPLEVLCLGMSRTGTESMAEGLRQLGYDHVCHGYDLLEPSNYALWTAAMESRWEGKGQVWTRNKWDQLLGHCQAVTDQPAICYAYDLIRFYPEAKVILTTRDTDEWFKSYRNTLGTLIRTSWWMSFESWFDFQRDFVYNKSRRRQLWWWEGDFERNGKRRFEEHNAMVRGLVPAERLLEYKAGEGWEKLCKFLDKPIPQTPFPNGNTPESFMMRIKKMNDTTRWRARRNLGLSCVVGILFCLTGYLAGKNRLRWRIFSLME